MGKNTRFKGLFDNIKKDVLAAIVEFVGSTMFFLFALGAVQTVTSNANPESSAAGTQAQGSDSARLLGYFYISFSFGISLVSTAFIFYRVTGSIFNPSVGLALCLIGAVEPVRFILMAAAQMLGGIVASAILSGLAPGKLTVSVALGAGTNRAQGLFIEAFATFALTISVLMLAAEKHATTPFSPLGFGFTLLVVMMFSVQYTGGAINTARAFGPACFEGFPSYHWIYWLGPTLGGLFAAGFYTFLKAVHYWNITPGQDSTDSDDAPMQGGPQGSDSDRDGSA